MNAGYISAFAAFPPANRRNDNFCGSMGYAASAVNVQWLLQEKTRGQELYQQFIEEASKLYVDALFHDQAEIPPLINLYASINKMRVLSNPGIAERADKVARIIFDTYVLPNKVFPRGARDDAERRAAIGRTPKSSNRPIGGINGGQKIVIEKSSTGRVLFYCCLSRNDVGCILRWVRARSACFAPFCRQRCAGRKPFPPDSPQATGPFGACGEGCHAADDSSSK